MFSEQENRTVTLTGSGIEKQMFHLHEIVDWHVVVDALLPHLHLGTILALSGDLGAGKTTFVQILAEVLGSKRIPQSPTFALMRSYSVGRGAMNRAPTGDLSRLIHVDAYRLEDERQLLPLDLDEELADGKSILVLEWPERVERWLARHSTVIWMTIKLS